MKELGSLVLKREVDILVCRDEMQTGMSASLYLHYPRINYLLVST